MISKNHKVLFYHIPRTGGSTIEALFVNYDYSFIDHKYKHPSLVDFKKKYSKEWDEYFKFTIVRNPYEWVRSLYSEGRCPNGDFTHFCNNLSFDIRDTQNGFIYENISGTTFTEIINNEFDKVYRFEELINTNFNELKTNFNLLNLNDLHLMEFSAQNHMEKPIHTLETFNIIKEKFKTDIETFYPELINITYEDVINKNYKL